MILLRYSKQLPIRRIYSRTLRYNLEQFLVSWNNNSCVSCVEKTKVACVKNLPRNSAPVDTKAGQRYGNVAIRIGRSWRVSCL